MCVVASHQPPPKDIEATHKRSIRVIILVSRVIAMFNFPVNKVIKITLIWSYLTLFESIWRKLLCFIKWKRIREYRKFCRHAFDGLCGCVVRMALILFAYAIAVFLYLHFKEHETEAKKTYITMNNNSMIHTAKESELVMLQLLHNWIKTWNKPNQCSKNSKKKKT